MLHYLRLSVLFAYILTKLETFKKKWESCLSYSLLFNATPLIHKLVLIGNLLMNFSESHFSEFIKLGFVLSVAVTFPMVIFPCRASLHSMLFRKVKSSNFGGSYVAENSKKSNW